MTEQQKKDRDVFTTLWYIIRDSDPSVIPNPTARWEHLLGMGEDIGKRYPEFRTTIADVLMKIENREKRGQK